ncbi:DNA/RNA non-specific endonuclease [Pseudobutyrivibrio sp.]|uniref:DNA/RNA non-specific endonuclease n=1 Tax=Pseudobutyrivibrio sp. TaxID=2014367 RepID=UPI001B5CC454|nr:DNA/RNA non-specific endonuclease [Pseudobutyrivibrio sp.]MBP3263601.1 DNA/RNA non-specific endonuclease [Pseudobutyrivibrio sp.]
MRKRLLFCLAACTILIGGYSFYGTSNAGDEEKTIQIEETEEVPTTGTTVTDTESTTFSIDQVGAYSGNPYIAINNNVPYFTDSEMTRTDAFETYSNLDSLGRCGVAYANICNELMPTEERGEIGSIKPSGWHTANYHEYIDGNYLYNRCHLIGYQLSGENANEKNLITGTRYLNVQGMLPFENEVADYVESTGNHVLYRVTPIFEGNNLVASGVLMEAYSVEDQGKGVMFNVYCYNVQPGIVIDYATGDSQLSSDATPIQSQEVTTESSLTQTEAADYVLNTNTKRFHYPDCKSVTDMKEKNKQYYHGSREDLINQGYKACGNCQP